MNIEVLLVDGAKHEISTTYDTTCGQLKDKINNILGLLPSEQILRFNNAELSNPNEKLMTYGIKNGSVINLILKLSQFTVVIGSPCGKSIKIPVNSENTVKSLKDEIQKQLNVPVEQQTLMFRDELLENNKKLSEYGIDKECLISLIPKLQDSTKNKFEIQNVDIKPFQLNYENPFRKRLLQSDSQFTVVNGSPCGKSIKIPVNSENNVKSLKDEIQKQLNVPVEQQTLMCRDEILENNKKLSEHGIDKECLISLIPKLQDSTKNKVEIQNIVEKPFQLNYQNPFRKRLLQSDRNEIQIILLTGTPQNIAVKINVKKCISDLKSKLQQNFKMKERVPSLIYQGEILHDDKTIDHYGIEENSVIIVHWRISEAIDRIKLWAKSLDGQVFVIYVSKNAKIYDIKSNIHEKLHIHPDDQKLIYQGALLRDIESLMYYQIRENSVIQVMPRMRF